MAISAAIMGRIGPIPQGVHAGTQIPGSKSRICGAAALGDRPRLDLWGGPPAPLNDVRFSNRPFEVKHFQTIRQCSVDVARRLVLLFGIGTRALVWGF